MRIIAGIYKNKKIEAPKGNATRPTSERLRESLFNIVQTYIEEAKVLDLCAGSGAMGIEALSRGASHVTFVDTSKESIFCIRKNIEQLQIKKATRILEGDIFRVLEKLEKAAERFDLIYVDAPYALDFTHEILKVIHSGTILVSGGMLFIEEGVTKKTLEEFSTLELMSSRTAGKALLRQWKRK